jgi:glycosyltransferase involved in cell wall biosynthesis
MKKRRFFISMHYMELGGAEAALIGMLQAIDYSRYEVDLFLHSHRGEMMQYIPEEVNILPEIKDYAMIEKPMTEALRKGCFRVVQARLKAKWQYKRYLKQKGLSESAAVFQYIGNAVTTVLPSLAFLGEYDLAISFLNPHNIVRDKVKAKKKICWIHTDYTNIDINVAQELPVWDSFDHIMSISPDVTKTFLQVFPSLKDKIVEMENILPADFIRKRAEEFDASAECAGDGIKVLSVGRFCEAKNYDNVPDICRCIRKQGIDLRWFLIGYGDDSLIRQRIHEAGMEDYVIILGKRTNPYPYMKACDIYAQPSRYEGKSVTVREAQILCKPVVVTDYPTAKSQINNNIDGVIVPMSNEGCAKGMVDFIQNRLLQRRIVEYLQQHGYGSAGEMEKLYKLISE